MTSVYFITFRYVAFAIKIWSTMLYNAPTSSEIMHGIAYFRISEPKPSVAKKSFFFINNTLPNNQKK